MQCYAIIVLIWLREAWDFCTGIINKVKASMGPWKVLDWQHMNFGKKIPSSLSKVCKTWLLLKGITLWNTWIENILQANIWQSLLEYTRIAWDKALK